MLSVLQIHLGRILFTLPNLLNSEKGRLPRKNLEVQKNVNSENQRVLKKRRIHWTKSADEVICHVRIPN